MSLRAKIAGVDFSGARDAGRHIWVAQGTHGPNGFQIDSLKRADKLHGGGVTIDEAMRGLRDCLSGLTESIIGLDFPFSIPATLIEQFTWSEFIHDFSRSYATPEEFRDDCRVKAKGKELKRATDSEAKVPWSAYNLRIYRQTWVGIRYILAPLISENRVRVIPTQTPGEGMPILAETCPASFLKHEGLYSPYKGRTPDLQKTRSSILAEITKRNYLMPVTGKTRRRVVEDVGGDALDAIIAAVCATRIDDLAPRSALERLEARVYF